MSTARHRSASKGRPQDERSPVTLSPTGVLLLSLGFSAALLLASYLPRVADNARLLWSFRGATGALLLGQGVLYFRLARAPAVRTLQVLLRPQHYVQALCQLAVFAYWGWYWRPVYEMAGLIAAQLVFAYAFDMLLAWSRRESYTLGFGPIPIIFSINLFLWFRDDWFYLQFLMIALGFLGKEFVRWNRDGRSSHIFNPSAFALGLFSLALIATGTTELTWGQDIASTLTLAPRIYSFLFLVGLVVMYFFAITPVAGAAAATIFILSALYGAATGVPYFLDSEIPAAVFLGLHLLVTDPSTSPRTTTGKVAFGTLYGLGVFGLYALLGATGSPTFYDKLLCVPLLNLSVRGIDSIVRALREGGVLGRLFPVWAPTRANLAHMGLWVSFFLVVSLLGKTDGRHPGDSLPFWEVACGEERRGACDRLLEIESTYCGDRSGWACNELGGHYARGTVVPADAEAATAFFGRACELRFQAACVNLLDPAGFRRTDPKPLDLRLLLREGGRNLVGLPEPELYARACEHGWSFACGRVASSL